MRHNLSRFNKWTLGLAAIGAVSLTAAAPRKTPRAITEENLYCAIMGYRGQNDPKTGKWKIPPDISQRRLIVNLLFELGRTKQQINQDARKIDAFKTNGEIIEWLKTL